MSLIDVLLHDGISRPDVQGAALAVQAATDKAREWLQSAASDFGKLIDGVLIVECPAKAWRLIEMIPEELSVI
ncbi:hypothetical protein [Methylorubrum extorquens]|uniref:hypothetical protein n=1 Tax=Methylorubrum extorquens TaxID=408 RepID=UPI0012DB41A7|nr:hypothetical protein [Methylorubrum extorquens]